MLLLEVVELGGRKHWYSTYEDEESTGILVWAGPQGLQHQLGDARILTREKMQTQQCQPSLRYQGTMLDLLEEHFLYSCV
jgi:hypothetical protein